MKRPRKTKQANAPKGVRKRLARLITRITKYNRHAETDWRPPEGKEE